MKHLIFIIALLVSFQYSTAQNYGKIPVHEIGIGFGVANYLGDLSATGSTFFFGEMEAKAFRPAFQLNYRNNFSSWFAFRATFGVSRIYGHDKFNANATRNLHFRSNVADIALMIEWNILPYKIGAFNRKFTPFIGVGVGGYYFNPKAELNGEWVRLQPLGTEGQGLVEYPNRTKYSLMDVSIPITAGFKWHVGSRIGMSVEMYYRYIFNDYLDDVSTVYPDFTYYQNNYISAVAEEAIALSYRELGGNPDLAAERARGNSGKDDTYFSFMFNISYRLGQGNVICPTLR